ncbi:hypothetical protein FA15DRAFT_700943 [Coprinopsis marcescibilis]|uniref:Phosphatidate phosphatase APP1 catalytic domain-containing protein n=1 Tax=Coprinopsis marcescibilis TaxID=230819 RepID=A0A5C3LIT7_COPMA|nr:hypothetical protein FA15DRAFT_700943 [Coprinopsis marcescibilis]
MKLSNVVVSLSVAAAVHARPAYQAHEARQLSAPGVLDEVLLFDGLAVTDAAGNTRADVSAYVSLRTPDLGIATAAVTALLSSLGIPVGNSLNILQDRLKTVASIGLPRKKVEISVPGCANKATLPSTSIDDLGLSNGIVSLGRCGGARETEATVSPGLFDSRRFKASIFSSANSGFGVLSDIDDTIKVSNVLDRIALLKSTLLEEPKAVPGMPELYASLATSLNSPQFVYLTATPYQFYPFLNRFVDSAYSASKGPILSQNLTIVDIPEAIEFISSSNTFAYKVSQIDRVQALYPNKKFLLIGDSTQADPEVYAASARKHGGFVSCIWIRQVEGANNAPERFAETFLGLDGKFRVFSDDQIAGLADIDIAGGAC